jgi:hypothetical protein
VTNAEPLLINHAGSLGARPEAYTEVGNLFLAADYLRTYTDLATMEAANEGGHCGRRTQSSPSLRCSGAYPAVCGSSTFLSRATRSCSTRCASEWSLPTRSWRLGDGSPSSAKKKRQPYAVSCPTFRVCNRRYTAVFFDDVQPISLSRPSIRRVLRRILIPKLGEAESIVSVGRSVHRCRR